VASQGTGSLGLYGDTISPFKVYKNGSEYKLRCKEVAH
jgi:hypothetical protein